jgi:hypothetical protein
MSTTLLTVIFQGSAGRIAMVSLSANRRPRRWTGLALVSLVPLGLYTKVYAGPAAAWVNNSLGGVFYVLFWCLLLFWLQSGLRPGRVALAVLAVTCLLEFLQRWHPPWLEGLRSFWLGQILLGTTFAWSDFPYYFIGAGLGWLWRHGFHPDQPDRR